MLPRSSEQRAKDDRREERMGKGRRSAGEGSTAKGQGAEVRQGAGDNAYNGMMFSALSIPSLLACAGPPPLATLRIRSENSLKCFIPLFRFLGPHRLICSGPTADIALPSPALSPETPIVLDSLGGLSLCSTFQNLAPKLVDTTIWCTHQCGMPNPDSLLSVISYSSRVDIVSGDLLLHFELARIVKDIVERDVQLKGKVVGFLY
jgi:hypothetical protein